VAAVKIDGGADSNHVKIGMPTDLVELQYPFVHRRALPS
jgi:hypothetical protein